MPVTETTTLRLIHTTALRHMTAAPDLHDSEAFERIANMAAIALNRNAAHSASMEDQT